MSISYLPSSRASTICLVCLLFLSCSPAYTLSGVVTLDSIEIYKTHEWLAPKPTVYFQCKNESQIILPDVRKAHVLYSFKSEESWQPLTEFTSTKCKRCGIYEKDSIKSDDVFDEWELCPTDFTAPGGRYIRFKDKELNATFLCSQCKPADSHSGGKGMKIAIIIISVVLAVATAGVIFGVYKFWQKKKREQDQARFLKLFEDGDELEDVLSLDNLT